jgi:hypothetical protein
MTTNQEAAPADPSVLRYVPLALYTFGCCHYGHTAPYRTGEVAADSLPAAWSKARLELKPSSTEHLCHVDTKSNPAFEQEQDRWIEAVQARGVAA